MKKLSADVRDDLLKEMRDAIVAVLKYLQTHVPLKDKFLANLKFIGPLYRLKSGLSVAFLFLATSL